MTFSRQLNDYLEKFDTNFAELSKLSGISTSTLSRYNLGKNTPEFNSRQINDIADGLFMIAQRKNCTLSREDILSSLNHIVQQDINIDYADYAENLQILLKSLYIRTGELARALSYDSSHISRVISGKRKPKNIDTFNLEVAGYISKKYCDKNSILLISKATGTYIPPDVTSKQLCELLVKWLGSNNVNSNITPVNNFLGKVNDFDLNDFVQKLDFSNISVPKKPHSFPEIKIYRTIDDMKQSDLDFLLQTLFSDSKSDCTMYSDMPIEEMAGDMEFSKKFIYGMAMLMKKGLHIHFIHDVHRPFKEMMVGLESFIPLYMTGQISPYYFPVPQGSVKLSILLDTKKSNYFYS